MKAPDESRNDETLVASRRRRRLFRLDRLSRRAEARVIYGNRVEVLADGRQAFDAMLQSIHGAKRSIAIEMYTWADDRLGRRFAEAVRAKAREAVAVFVLVDAFGSFGGGDLMESLELAGAEVRWYHPLAPWTPSWYPNLRDHRKMLLVDGEIGFAGGMNLGEEYTSEFNGDAAWRDLMVRVEGPAVREMTRLFLGSWLRSSGDPEAAGVLAPSGREAGRAGVQVVGGTGIRGRRRLRKYYLAMIAMARKRIFLANAYFAPERILRHALCRAAGRGVEVELLLPAESDAPMVRWAGRASYGRLLEAGVRVRELHQAVLHAKVAVFDDEVLLTGSANLDHRSFRHNLEVAVNVFDRGAASEALATLERSFADATEVNLDAWRQRPWPERLQERLASLVSYWL